MRPYTTPTHTIRMKIDPTEWDEFRITYSQLGKTILEKTQEDLGDCVTMPEKATGDEKFKILVRLTQQETALFKPKLKLCAQIHCHYPDGATLQSNEMTAFVEGVQNKEILGNGN